MNIIQDPDDAVIVQSTINLGHNLEYQVVAEGVENIETLERLRGLGCDQAQGYYLSRPLPADDITSWFAQSRWGAPLARGMPVARLNCLRSRRFPRNHLMCLWGLALIRHRQVQDNDI